MRAIACGASTTRMPHVLGLGPIHGGSEHYAPLHIAFYHDFLMTLDIDDVGGMLTMEYGGA